MIAFTAVTLVLVTAARGRLGYRHGEAMLGANVARLFDAHAIDRNQATR